MKEKINKILKNISNSLFGFMFGIVVASSIGVFAATTLASRSVYYDNSTSGGSSTTVSGAIDELYDMAKTHCPEGYSCTLLPPKYYAFGLPNATSPTNYNDVITSSGVNAFVQLEGEQLSACIYRNNTLECFKNNNYEEEKEHLKQVFGKSNCSVGSSYSYCDDSVFYCDASPVGDVSCIDRVAGHECYVYAYGLVSCS